MTKRKQQPPAKKVIIRAYRISDETHLKLKELAKADDRKIGSKLTEIINKAHTAWFSQQRAA